MFFSRDDDRRGVSDVPMREILDLLGWEPRKSTTLERVVLISAVSSTLIVVPLFFIMRFAGQSSTNSLFVSISFFSVIALSLFFFLRQNWPSGSGGYAALSAFLESTKIPSAITDSRGKLVGSNKLYRHLYTVGVFSPDQLMEKDKFGELGFVNLKSRIERGQEGRAFLSLTHNFFEGLVNSEGVGNYELIARPHGNYVVWRLEKFDPNIQVYDAISWFDKYMKPFLEKSSMSVLIFNNEGELEYYNPATLSVLGLNRTSLDNINRSMVVGEGGLLAQASAEGRIDIEFQEIALPGLSENDNSPGGTAFILRENEGQKFVGNAHVTQQDLARIYEASPIAIVSLGEDGEVLEFNRAFSKLYIETLGVKLMLGDNFESFVHHDHWQKISAAIKGIINGHKPKYPIEFAVNGSESQVFQTFFGSGSSYGSGSAILYMIDTTDQKRLELQFAQGQKMQAVGQLAGGVAHDFNNLLTAVIGFCDLLLVRHGAGDQSFADIMQIKQNANRGANLVRQLLAFSRRQTLQPKILNVTDVIAELANLIRRLVGESIEFEIIHGRDLGSIRVDQGQLEQVIINLAVNARDAIIERGKDDGYIKFRTRNIRKKDCKTLGFEVMKAQNYVEIIVEDNGSGIPAELHDKVFEPFFTTKEVGKGTGLGLATVYGIVKQTGGYIFVDPSRTKGTAIKLYLPVHEEELAINDATHVEMDSSVSSDMDLTGSANILVVEDEDAVRLFTVRALANKGYDIIEADSGERALELIKETKYPIDLMVSDVVMPGMDGPTLARQAHKLQPKMKIILTSGYAEEAFSKKQDKIKYEFLPKPFSLDELASRVKKILSDS